MSDTLVHFNRSVKMLVIARVRPGIANINKIDVAIKAQTKGS